MKQVQGRLTAFGFRTTQGEWTFDVSTVTGVAAPQSAARADAQPHPSAPPQPPGPCGANQMKNTAKPPRKNLQQATAETSRVRDPPHSDDDDDAFMEPLPWRPVPKKQCLNAGVDINPAGKRPKVLVKRAHALTVRCAPSSLNLFVENLTLRQRKKIIDMGFGGLLCISADRLESRELLKFLFDRLDPKTMVIHVSKDKAIDVTPFAIKQVLGLPDGGEVLHLHTHTQASKALVVFKNSVGLQESQELHASNKLLFPRTDNNVRCKDVYLTRDLSSLPGLNWCRAVFDDLRDAALSWQVDKEKKSISGCSLLLIILYLDNLQCAHQIGHTMTPRAKYFDQDVIKKLIRADRTKDQQGKATFGLLPLRNNINTCYYMPNNPSSSVPPTFEPLAPYFPSLQAELQELVSQIRIESRKMQAMQTLANFDAKAKEALSHMDIGQQMLRDAHAAVIHTLRSLLNDEVHSHNSVEHHDQPHTCDAAQADDVDMYDGRNRVHNKQSEHASDLPSFQPASMENGAHTNLDLDQGAAIDLQKEFDALFPLVCTQVPANAPIDQITPPVVDKGNTGTTSPASSTHYSYFLLSVLPLLLSNYSAHCVQDNILHPLPGTPELR